METIMNEWVTQFRLIPAYSGLFWLIPAYFQRRLQSGMHSIRSLLGMRAILEQIGFALLSAIKYVFYKKFFI